MTEMLAENLSGKDVVGDDGAEVGMLYNVTMDLQSGELANLIVEPDENAETTFPVDDEGRYRVPVERVASVQDYIVVRR
jgi:sporulation protein YlmC with PRC-barrel domain